MLCNFTTWYIHSMYQSALSVPICLKYPFPVNLSDTGRKGTLWCVNNYVKGSAELKDMNLGGSWIDFCFLRHAKIYVLHSLRKVMLSIWSPSHFSMLTVIVLYFFSSQPGTTLGIVQCISCNGGWMFSYSLESLFWTLLGS